MYSRWKKAFQTGAEVGVNRPGNPVYRAAQALSLPVLRSGWRRVREIKRPSRVFAAVLPGVFAFVFTACTGDKGTGPVEVKWDRDTCKRCRMVLSDRHHSAQVRYQLPGERSRIFKFDDIGCALIWLEDKRWRDDPATEIWVNDHRNGKWIDARTATFIPGQMTPMGYGLGAQTETVNYGLTFVEARRHILDVEKRQPAHSAHLQRKRESESTPEKPKPKRPGDDCE